MLLALCFFGVLVSVNRVLIFVGDEHVFLRRFKFAMPDKSLCTSGLPFCCWARYSLDLFGFV